MASDDTFTAEVPTEIEEHENFDKWEEKIDGTLLTKIEAAREKIQNSGHVTNTKDLKDGLYEKKWGGRSGLRLYFAIVEDEEGRKTLLLLGSGKGSGQEKAIKKSK